MSYEIELAVELLIPDNVAFTAFNTLKKMGFGIEELKRADYYKFVVSDDVDFDEFSQKLGKVDVLVNANKHKATITRAGDSYGDGCFIVVVQDIDEPIGLLTTLKERLGLSEIEEMEKGTMWKLFVKDRETAKKIAEGLLYNRHYQKYEII
ncbi:hypothetical protein JXA85_01935 [Candidatus Woesearchaeota archaeon]|nr:hypothetical protein [Candidatus Woesearchaeota archaeon]